MAKKRTEDAGDTTRWSESEAREALRELARTGESRLAFARRKSVSPQRVIYWQKKLAREKKSIPAFVHVAVPERSPGRADIEVQLGAITVGVREGVDVEYVARLVAALARAARSC